MIKTAQARSFDAEAAVAERYAAAAEAVEVGLCCPSDNVASASSAKYLAAIPEEIIAKDYGCGDPSPYVKPGETVVDLGSGAGKLCYILAQVVGPDGNVIGVDCNRKMLALARRHRQTVADRLGYSNVRFCYGLIQDLRLDLDALAAQLEQQPVRDPADWLALRSLEERLRRDEPMIEDATVDCVVSNCVLNLVRPADRGQLFAEIFRVLRRDGRAVISDIVSDEDVPEHLRQDPQLWSGCISGAFREDRFLAAFEEAGFHGIQIASRQREPWQTVEGIEFRSLTVIAYKGKQGPCLERNQAVIYRGPFKTVNDDDGHTYYRGERMAVCDKTFRLLQQEPYSGMFEPVEPYETVPLDQAEAFDCRRSARRAPHETKGMDYRRTTEPAGPCCGEDGTCC